MRNAYHLMILVTVASISACAMPPKPETTLLSPTEAQMQLRSYQTRSFDVADRNRAIRAVMATLQDLGFIIERANADLGLVTAARFAEPNYLDIIAVTVTVRQNSDDTMMVRVNAIYNNAPIEDPKAYQNFFATLQRALFLGTE